MRRKMTLLAGILLVFGLFVYCSVLFAQAPAPAAAEAPNLKVEETVTLWALIKSGGWAMWALGACSFAVVGLTIFNFQRVSMKKMIPLGVIGQIKAAAATGDIQQMVDLSNSSDSMFTRSLSAGLKHVQPDDLAGSRPKVEQAIGEAAGREESRYGFFVNFLALLTSMAPMWGLLGTVSGMIGAFSKIGSGGMGKPEMLAKNIGEALVCTASGLMIAITAMGFYFLFKNILNTVMKESEAHFSEILDSLMDGRAAATEEAKE